MLAAKADGPVFLSIDTHWNGSRHVLSGTRRSWSDCAHGIRSSRSGVPRSFQQMRTGVWNGDMALMYGLYNVLTERSTQWAPTTPLLSRKMSTRPATRRAGAYRVRRVRDALERRRTRALVLHDSLLLDAARAPDDGAPGGGVQAPDADLLPAHAHGRELLALGVHLAVQTRIRRSSSASIRTW